MGQLAFKNQSTGQYIKWPNVTATHWSHLNYTDDIDDAWLYPVENFDKGWNNQEPYIQCEIKRWKERTGEIIIPVVTHIKDEGDYVWTPWSP